MRATWKATRVLPIAVWNDQARADAEIELRSEVAGTAYGAGAQIPDDVEVDVAWIRDAELVRNEDDQQETRLVMVGTATLSADVDDDGAPRMVTLDKETAEVLLAQGVQTDRERARMPLCGSPARRHSFLHREAIAMRDGVIQHAVCQDCGRDVPRDELLKNRLDEERNIDWWTL